MSAELESPPTFPVRSLVPFHVWKGLRAGMDCNRATWTQAGATELTAYTLLLENSWGVTITHCREEGSPLFTAWLVQGWPRALTSYKRTPRQRLCSVLSPPNRIHVSPFGSTLNLWCKILPNLRNACSAATTPLALRELSWSLWSDDLPPRYRHRLLVLANTWLFHIIKGAP